jgi:membrane associated rhomboid family serine protease
MHQNGLRLRLFSAATCLAVLTVSVSLGVAYLANGSFLKIVRVADLRHYGGTTFEDLRHLELWRIALAQMVHTKIPHMWLSAGCLLLLGGLLETTIGPWKLLLIWLLAGGAATAVSPVLVEAPLNVGTGSTQAVFAFAGCAAVLAAARRIDRRWALAIVTPTVISGVLLDLLFEGYPKPGHVTGFLFGAASGLVLLKLRPRLPLLRTYGT